MSLSRACSVWAIIAVVMCSAPVFGGGGDDALSVNYGRLGVATDIYSASPEYAVPLDAEAQAAALPDLKGMLVVDQYAEMLGVSSDDLEINKYKWNPEGDLHISFKQMYEGFPVYLTSVSVHFYKDGMLQGISANTVPLSILEQLDLGVLVEEKELQTLINADSEAMKESYEFQKAEQLIYVPALNPESDADIYENYLVWNVNAKDSNGLPWSIFVDAKTGAVLKYDKLFRSLANNLKICSSDYYSCTGINFRGRWLYGSWAPNSDCNSYAYCEYARDNVATVYNYYDDNLNRSGWKNDYYGCYTDVFYYSQSGYAYSYPTIASPLVVWNIDINHRDFLPDYLYSITSSSEIIGHEFTHGVIYYEFNNSFWGTNGQSHAMEESFCDIMGILIGDQGDWVFGDDYSSNSQIVPFRIIDNPNNNNEWNPLMTDLEDYCNPEPGKPHAERWESYAPMLDSSSEGYFNSTIFSKIFQLYVDGGTYNGMTLVGVGETIARDVWYKALTEAYWQTSQDAQQWAYRAVLACQNEYGSTHINCTRLLRASAAVGIAPLPRTISVSNVSDTPHPVSFDDYLWVFWRDSSTGEIKYKTTSSSIESLTAPTWSSTVSTGKYASTSPTPIVYNGRLMLFWTRSSDNQIRFMSYVSSWSSEYSPADSTSSSSNKIATAIRSSNSLYIVYKSNSTTYIRYRSLSWASGGRYSSNLWSSESILSNSTTSYAPAAATYDDDLLVVYRDSVDNDVERTFISGSVMPENVQEKYSEDDLHVKGDMVGWAHNSRQYFFARHAYSIDPSSSIGYFSSAVGDEISDNWYAYVNLGSTTISTNAPGVTTHDGYMVITSTNSDGNINYMFIR